LEAKEAPKNTKPKEEKNKEREREREKDGKVAKFLYHDSWSRKSLKP